MNDDDPMEEWRFLWGDTLVFNIVSTPFDCFSITCLVKI